MVQRRRLEVESDVACKTRVAMRKDKAGVKGDVRAHRACTTVLAFYLSAARTTQFTKRVDRTQSLPSSLREPSSEWSALLLQQWQSRSAQSLSVRLLNRKFVTTQQPMRRMTILVCDLHRF